MRPRKMAPGLLLLLINFILLSCGDKVNPQEQAKILLTSLQHNNIDTCVDMTYAYQAKLAKLQDEPKFKHQELTAKYRHDIKEEFFNEHKHDSIVYVFSFPCQWKILETKTIPQETPDGQSYSLFRIFVAVNYTSDNQSPDSVPLLAKESSFKYKVKEIILHLDFETTTGLYLGWGTDKHVPW